MTAITLTQRPVFICEQCWQPLSQRRDGYLAVDLTAVDAAVVRDGARINWRVRHEACDEAAAATDYRVWVRAFKSTTDLVEHICVLADRKLWLGSTNWPGLLRRVLADTERHAAKCTEATHQRVRKGELKHGTYGYSEGCRCEECTMAHREQARDAMARRRARQAGS